MAGDSELTAAKAVRNGSVLLVGLKDADDTGLLYLDVSTMDGSKVIFLCTVAGTDTNTALVFKDGGAFSAGAVGDLTIETSAASSFAIGPLETARFSDSDGIIWIKKDTHDTTKLKMRAILLP